MSRVLLPLSTVFGMVGGIPRFNQMLCMAIDQLAPDLGLQGSVICQHDSVEDYARAGRPWRHLRFVAGEGQWTFMARTMSACVRERPDLLLLGLLGYAPLGLACRPFVRGGFGFVAHGMEIWDETRWSRRFCARRARFALAVSRYTAASVHEIAGLDNSAIRLLHNTLDPSFEHLPFEPEPDGAGGELELLTVSRLDAAESGKGVDRTIEVFARLCGRHPEVRYRIVGRGTDKPRLQQLAASLGLADRVVFEQDLSDEELAERYRRCSIFVMPSGQEGFGIVFLEAMRFGKPCIGGEAGGTPDVVVHGETGLLVPFGDLDALEAAMERLLVERALRIDMGRAGWERLDRHFTFERFRERIGGYLGELLQRGPKLGQNAP